MEVPNNDWVPATINTDKIIHIKPDNLQHGTIQACSTDGTTGNRMPNGIGKPLIPAHTLAAHTEPSHT